MLVPHNVRMVPLNVRKKNKGAIECDKITVTCDVDTAQCEDGTIRCDVLVTWYSKLPTSGYCTKKKKSTIELVQYNKFSTIRSLPYPNAL